MKSEEKIQEEKEIIRYKEKLSTGNIQWINRALIVLYNLQTNEEKIKKETSENNTVGFNGVDSKILTSFTEQIINGKNLSNKQIEICKKLLPKYSKQLYRIAQNKKNEELNNN